MCNTKICKRCGEEQSIDNFYKVPSMKDGHDNTCKACRKKLRRLRDGVKVEPLITEGVMVCPVCKRELSVDTYAKSKTGRYWMCSDCYKEHTLINNGSAKNRAARKGLEFNLELSDIVIPDVCPLLEVPFQFGTKDSYDYSPSLDRIDNSKGYIKGNVQVISMKANAMKNSASPDELHTFCKNILRHSPNCIE